METIKILRSSIKKNPNAGSTVTYIKGLKTATFEIKGNIPDLVKEVPFFITEYQIEADSMIFARGSINGPIEPETLALWIKNIPNLNINIDQGINRIEHMPEPNYLFEYETKELECEECGTFSNILHISMEDGLPECPSCFRWGTFPEYEYEGIDEALKDVKVEDIKYAEE